MPKKDYTWPTTVEEAAELILYKMTDKDKNIIGNITFSCRLIQFHHGWGTFIRNQCGLWKGNKELLKSCGGEWMHPDSASGVIMKAVWSKLNKYGIENDRKLRRLLLLSIESPLSSNPVGVMQ